MLLTCEQGEYLAKSQGEYLVKRPGLKRSPKDVDQGKHVRPSPPKKARGVSLSDQGKDRRQDTVSEQEEDHGRESYIVLRWTGGRTQCQNKKRTMAEKPVTVLRWWASVFPACLLYTLLIAVQGNMSSAGGPVSSPPVCCTPY
ncbi:hypothetical protein ACOMHN_053199 [Nucella lapillus]